MLKGEPLGLLHGVPFSVKDVLDTRGITTTHGSRLFADAVPEHDAVAVGRLRADGAVILGKTTTSEFGHKAVTESPLFGVTRNPWNLELHAREARREARRRRWRAASAPSPSARMAVARSAFPRPFAGCSASSPRTDASRAIRRHPAWSHVSHVGPDHPHRARRGGRAGRHRRRRRSRSPLAPRGRRLRTWRRVRRMSRDCTWPGAPISDTRRWRPRCARCARTPPPSSRRSAATSRW